jgi:exonuclease SbcC
MRIKTLEIQGFGPYLNKQSIDFTQYEADGLFIIVGETGAGKSSLLDAITFALYGSTPRWKDTAATKDNQTYRSHFAKDTDPTKVTLNFEVNGQEYRITRSPKYVTSSGKSVLDTAQLEKLHEGSPAETIAIKAKTVADHVFSLIKLSSDEFLQVILLAQGRFDNFLQATSTERMELLSKIFNTGRFGTLEERIDQLKKDVEQDLNQQRQGFRATLNALQSQLNESDPEPGDELKWVEKLTTKYKGMLEKAQAQVEVAKRKQEEAGVAKKTAQAQETLGKIQSDLKDLQSQSKNIELLQKKLELADSASRVIATFEARNQAKQRVTAESTGYEKSQKELAKSELNPNKKGIDDSLLLLKGELEQLIATEKEMPGWEETIRSLKANIKALEVNFSDFSSEVNDASKRILVLEKLEEEYDLAKEKFDNNLPLIQKAEEIEELSEEIADLKNSVPKLEEKVAKAKSDLEVAAESEKMNLASILATSLTKGEPCVVCGSKEHPKPHKATSANTKSKDTEHLRAALVSAESNLQTTRKSIATLQAKLTKLKDALKDVSISGVKKETIAAEKIVDGWPKLSKELKVLRESVRSDSKLNKEIASITAKLPDSRLRLKTTEESLEAAKKAISKKLDGFKTISARKKKVTDDLELLKLFRGIETRLAAAESALKTNDKALATLLLREKFSSEVTFTKAILQSQEYKSIEKAVREHGSKLIELQGLLAQDIYKSLPSVKVNLATASATFAEADLAFQTSMQNFADLKSKAKAIDSAEKQLNGFASKMKTLSSKFIVHERLLNTVRGKSPNNLNMPLETFVLAAELEAILEAANYHLGKLSKGQYSFQHTEKSIQKANTKAGLGIEVMDSHTSIARDAHSLSGGETFLASISLALGLAEVVTGRAGGISIDTLFIDEGFGSLSSEFLDLVIETLDSLRVGGRTIGVISHGETMKERIASQLQVFKEPGGTSKVIQMS